MRNSVFKKMILVFVTLALSCFGLLSTAGPAAAAVSCTTHKGNTAGWIHCTGSGTVRLVIDCKAPQVTDVVGPWTTYNGSVDLSGQCRYGVNSTQYQVK